MDLGSYHKSNDSSCKAHVSDSVLYSSSHKFSAGDEGDAAGCYNSSRKGSYDSRQQQCLPIFAHNYKTFSNCSCETKGENKF